MKRVVLVTDFFRPEPGGIEGLFTGIARHWPEGFLEVVVSAAQDQYLSRQEFRNKFDQNEPYSIYRASVGGFLYKEGKEFAKLFAERLDKFHAEHVILGSLSRSARMAAKVAKLKGIPYSVFLNGSDLKNRLGFHRIWDRQLVLSARTIFTVSRFIARSAREFGIYEEKISVIPPGIESRFSRGKHTPPLKVTEAAKKKIVLVGLGPFLPRKGFDLAIDAMFRLRHLKQGLHLVLVGSGPEFSYLQELIRIRGLEDCVTLTGFLSDDQLAGVMQTAHIFIQPGVDREDDAEGVHTSLMEAAYFGLPAIVGRIGGREEIVRDGISGFLVEPGSVEGIAKRIEELAKSDTIRNKFGKTARDIALKDFDITRTAAAILHRI